MAIGVRQAMILQALRDNPESGYAGGLHEMIYKRTSRKVIITSDTICQVFKTLLVRRLIEQTEPPENAQVTARARRGAPRKFYKLTEAGHAEMELVNKVVALFEEREWRQT
jgi:DNA-binding PadR family transcriptional regulator